MMDTTDVVDDYHGISIADPYRWLEQLDSAATRDWIDLQNQRSFEFLEHLPQRESIRARLGELWNYPRYSAPVLRGQRYFYTHNNGLQNQAVVVVQQGLNGEPRALLDPNELSDDGTIALSHFEVSPDGRYLAYGTSSGGSDWQQWRIRDVQSADDLPEVLDWVKFSGASWTADSKGFFYSRYDEPEAQERLKSVNVYHKLYYHRLGQAQSDDALIFEQPQHREHGFWGEASEDGRYLVIHVWKGTLDQNLLYIKDLQRPDAPPQPLVEQWHSQFEYLGNDGRLFWFLTDHYAPRRKVIQINLDQPQRWQTLVAQTEDTLEQASFIGNQFVLTYLHDAHHRVRLCDRQGECCDLALPGIGAVDGFRGSAHDSETFFSYTSFNTPPTIYRLDMKTARAQPFKSVKVPFDPKDYVTRQVFYSSKDGVRIPMFISHRKDVTPTAQTPLLLYGYGGFNVSLTPAFKVRNLAWMEMGGVFAVANLRGGGEYGKAWHDAGVKLKKQNVFDDFIAAAEWLIDNRYSSAQHLAIHGGSNGGLLVAACMLQRPDLFAAVAPAVGVLDMLRFNQFTIGWAWESDFGSPQNEAEFHALRAYSPLHNIEPGRHYPPTLITTGDHDDRVFPAHSFKFAAALQQAQGGDAPILIRIETRAGHGAGMPTDKQIELATDMLAFLRFFTTK